MCFRPADGAGGGPMKCPECGKPIQMMAGIKLEKCPFCKCDFTPYLNGEKPLPGQEGAAPAADAAPAAAAPAAAPAAPKAPGVPKAPGKPNAPQPPAAPGW